MTKTGVITANYVHEINGYQPATWPEMMQMHKERFGPQNLDAMLGRIAGMGFGYVELWIGTTGTLCQDPLWQGTTPDDILGMFAKHGLQVASFCPGGIGSQTDMVPLFEFAQALKAPMLTGWLGREPELWETVAGYLERYDTRFGIEPHGPTYSLSTVQEIENALAVSDRIGVCPDTGVWAAQDIDPPVAVEVLAERVIHTHLKGYNKAQSLWCAPGDDDIGLDRVVRILRDTGYQGVYSIEFEAAHDSDAEVARARQMVLDILSEE